MQYGDSRRKGPRRNLRSSFGATDVCFPVCKVDGLRQTVSSAPALPRTMGIRVQTVTLRVCAGPRHMLPYFSDGNGLCHSPAVLHT